MMALRLFLVVYAFYNFCSAGGTAKARTSKGSSVVSREWQRDRGGFGAADSTHDMILMIFKLNVHYFNSIGS